MLFARLRKPIAALTILTCTNAMVLLDARRAFALGSPLVHVSAQQRGGAQPAGRQDLITRGKNLFDDQQYEESIQTLSAALLRPNNTKEQRIEIYRLLAYNYITLNRKEEAESAARGLFAKE